MDDDRDVADASKLALADAPASRVVPGFELSGALSVSCFAVAEEIEARSSCAARDGPGTTR
ncbi:MAG: hypothetical protein M0Z40_10105 [Actinomycetota bacterium]|jgi:hypothetical protein|nr:hypothetical protein [Actinomycetota bacterium]MDA8075567.1 hypothetical protein [Actinomycetota bacterium]